MNMLVALLVCNMCHALPMRALALGGQGCPLFYSLPYVFAGSCPQQRLNQLSLRASE